MRSTAQDFNLMVTVWAQTRDPHLAGIDLFQDVLLCYDLGVTVRSCLAYIYPRYCGLLVL